MEHFLLGISSTCTGRGKGFKNLIPSPLHQCDKVLHTWHFQTTGKLECKQAVEGTKKGKVRTRKHLTLLTQSINEFLKKNYYLGLE
jgi:hypothetical protein